MSYTAPALTAPVVLQSGYTRPDLSVPVVLGQGEQPAITAVLSAQLAPILPRLSIAATGEVRAVAQAALAATLTAPAITPTFVCAAQSISIHVAQLAAQLAAAVPSISITAAASYDVSLPDATAIPLAQLAQQMLPRAARMAQSQQQMRRTAHASAQPAQQMLPCSAGMRSRETSARALRRASRVRHQHGLPLSAGTGSRQHSTRALRRPLRLPHHHALPCGGGSALTQASTLRPGRLLRIVEQQAQPIAKPLPAKQQAARQTATRLRIQWQHGMAPQPGRWWPLYEPPGLVIVLSGPYTPRPLKCAVVLGPGYEIQPPCDYNPPDQPGHIIPVRRAYMIENEVTLRRVDSGAHIQALSLDLAIDRDSWTWAWSADIADHEWSALAAQNGEPLEIEASVNGFKWRLVAEGAPSRTRSFGRVGVRIGGRGIACELDDPQALMQDFYSSATLTAQQLMALALTYNGAPLGWSVDWRITDWLVPAHTWSVSGAPIAGVLDVASAVQAVVQADRTTKTLHVLSRYPAAPWAWGALTPDIEIPPDIIMSETLDPAPRAPYNAIFVSGQAQGGMARVKRAGTAGDKVAPMVTHALLTDTHARRQRGIAELSQTGRIANVSIALPISADTSLIEVGQFASFVESADPWRGLVIGTAISAKRSEDAGLRVTQSPTFERHYA